MTKICAVIPAYNEAKGLSQLIAKIKKHITDIILVDDGSQDDTAKVAQGTSVLLIRHAFNQGKGSSLKHGFEIALAKGYDKVVILDADGQHSPEQIPLFIERLKNSNAGVFIGNRLSNPKGMPLARLLVNKLFSKIVSDMCGQNIPDALCGFRIIDRKVLESIKLNTDRFDIDSEMLIKAARGGFKIESVKIESIYSSELSKIRPFTDGYRFFRLIINEIRNKRNV